MQPNGLHPVVSLRDPHAFHLADLARFSPQAPSQIQYHAQAPLPQHDVFGPSSSPFTPPGAHAQPAGAMHYYHGLPSSYSTNMHGLGGVLPSNSPRANQSAFSMASSNQPLYTSPYRTAGSLPLANGMSPLPATQIPITPRQQRNSRLSISGGTGAPLTPRELSPNGSPPKTAQDLLLRVLGTAPGQSTLGNTNGHGGQVTGGHPRLSASPPRVNSSGSSPDANRPTPLLFGGSDSIWAP